MAVTEEADLECDKVGILRVCVRVRSAGRRGLLHRAVVGVRVEGVAGVREAAVARGAGVPPDARRRSGRARQYATPKDPQRGPDEREAGDAAPPRAVYVHERAAEARHGYIEGGRGGEGEQEE